MIVDTVFCFIGIVLTISGIVIWRKTARAKKESQPIGWCFALGGISLVTLTAASLFHLIQ